MVLPCDLGFLLLEVRPKEIIKYLNKDLCKKKCDLYDL